MPMMCRTNIKPSRQSLGVFLLISLNQGSNHTTSDHVDRSTIELNMLKVRCRREMKKVGKLFVKNL